jgi:phosphopantothenoylcysteine decarboxylase/phosphopantothenate--cysteine ligase
VVLNDVAVPGIGFDATENEVTLVTAAGEEPVPRGAKADVARVILSCVDRLRADLGTRTP